MRILAHIHTFNDADIIDRTIAALLAQTRPVDGIVVVDNGSSDATLAQASLKHATVLRHRENLGTSGAIVTGMNFALEQGFDWIWIFDADSVVRPDALEKLLALYSGWPREQQQETAFLACLPRNQRDDQPYHGGVLTPRGIDLVTPASEHGHYPCHVTIWSGCLFRLDAVRRIGVPDPNYVLDWGEFEYGARIMRAQLKGYIHQDAVLEHNIRGAPSLNPIDLKIGGTTARFYEFPPIRCYYMCRNTLYFALYDFAGRQYGFLRGLWWYGWRLQGKPGPVRGVFWRSLRLTVNFLVRPGNHRKQIGACFRGMWHGLTGNIAARY
jgi:rhamnosyltransferase